MRVATLFSLMLPISSYVLAQHRHHHGDLKMDDFHRRIQKRNATPFETPSPEDRDEAASTGTSADSPYTSLEGSRPYYETTTTTSTTTDTSASPTTSKHVSTHPSPMTSDRTNAPTPLPAAAIQASAGTSQGSTGGPVSGTSATLLEPPERTSTPTSAGTSSAAQFPADRSGITSAPTPFRSPLPIVNMPDQQATTDSTGLDPPTSLPAPSSLPEISGGLSVASSASSAAKSASPTIRPVFPIDRPGTSNSGMSNLIPVATTTIASGTSTSPVATNTSVPTNTTALPAESETSPGTSLVDPSEPTTTLMTTTTVATGTSPATSQGAAESVSGLDSTSTTMPTQSSVTESPTMVLPPTIITAEPTAATDASGGSGSSDPQATAGTTNPVVNALPAAIAPATGMAVPNTSQTIVQFGFYEQLNYPFVVSNALATAQILSYAPKCAAYALGLPAGSIIDNSLRPYTMAGYTATVAYLIIPSSSLEKLEALWSNATSKLYNQADSSLQSLVVLIDRSIPLLLPDTKGSASNGVAGTSSTNTGTSGSTVNPASFGSLADTRSSTSGSVKKIAGIGLGSAAAAGAYATLMFYAARRYRSRRTTLYAPSAPSVVMRPGSNYNGGISISRPMNPENSLGI